MRKFAIVYVLIFVCFAGVLNANAKYNGSKNFGVGIYMGYDAGLSFKSWMNRDNALQVDVNWNFNWGSMGVGAAYLVHNYEILKAEGSRLPVYFGIKGWANFDPGGARAGVQVPLGISWIFRDAPIDIFVQIEPGIQVIPDMHFAPNGGVGIRFWP